jgi:thiol-disulfide isomerase/thioredoxin
MSGALPALTVLAVVLGAAGLTLGLLLARRYAELMAALRAGAAPAPDEQAAQLWLPAVGSPAPAELIAPTVDGPPVTGADFAGADVVVAFFTSGCTSCRAALATLRATLAALPADGPRPVAVLRGAEGDMADYRRELTGLARVVSDAGAKKGGLAGEFGVRSYPAVLVLGGGVVRRAGMTVADVALAPA